METIQTNSWQEFEDALNSVRTRYGTFRLNLEDNKVYEQKNLILFRGQSNSKWLLSTTLERKDSTQYSVQKYMEKVLRAHNELESFTGKSWQVPPYNKLGKEIQECQDTFKVHLPAYSFLVYLRHHGYPSPLLDWTTSPYIAAYFAYWNSQKENPAVYCYIERPNPSKIGTGGDSMITMMGPFVSTHPRHFAQRATYTISTYWDYRSSQHIFCPHENVFEKNDEKQDVLIKIELSQLARSEALQKLSDYNINHFTLFQSEDALVRALEFKHFDFEDL